MNIFALHPDPIQSAQWHCDQHTSKMILESAQMLSTAMIHWDQSLASLVYAPTHPNHPCTLWVKQSKANAYWIVQLMQELDMIRTSMYTHDSMYIPQVFLDHFPVDQDEMTPFVFAGPDHIIGEDIHQRYRNLYKYKRELWSNTKRPMTYKWRKEPSWLTDSLSN